MLLLCRAVILCTMLLLVGCANQMRGGGSTEVTYDGQKYHSTDEVMQVILRNNAEELAAVPVAEKPLGGRAKVLLPDRDRLRPLAASHVSARINAEAAIGFIIAVERADFLNNAAGLQRSKLFDTVDIVEANNVENPDIAGYDYLVWYEVTTTGPNHTGQWVGHWLVRRAKNPRALPAIADAGAPRRERLATWVKAVQTALDTLADDSAGISIAGAPTDGTMTQRGGLTGIVVSTKGQILTNDHGVKDCKQMRVRLEGKKSVAAKIVARDGENDLALLKVDANLPAAVSFREGAEIRQGDAVIALGYPLSGLLSSDIVATTGTVNALVGMRDDARQLQMSAPVQPGNSGGPLLDAGGTLIGIVTGKLNALQVAAATGDIAQNVNFAIKSSVAREFLAKQSVAYGTAPAARDLPASEVIEQAKRFTVALECWR